MTQFAIYCAQFLACSCFALFFACKVLRFGLPHLPQLPTNGKTWNGHIRCGCATFTHPPFRGVVVWHAEWCSPSGKVEFFSRKFLRAVFYAQSALPNFCTSGNSADWGSA